MDIANIIECLDRFNNVLNCSYDECPIYRTELQSCIDGEELCLCFSEAKRALLRLKQLEDDSFGIKNN